MRTVLILENVPDTLRYTSKRVSEADLVISIVSGKPVVIKDRHGDAASILAILAGHPA